MDAKIPLAVRIERGGKLISQSIIIADADDTFLTCVRSVSTKIIVEEIEVVYTGHKSLAREDLFEIAPDTKIADAAVAVGSCTKLLCLLKAEIDSASTSVPNAFDRLMTNAVALKLPEMRPKNDGRDELYNRVVHYLEEKKLGFRMFQKADMEYFMSTVTSVLWYLDGQWAKFSAAPSVSSLPSNLNFTRDDKDTFRKLHSGSQRKKTLPRMKKTDLIEHFDKLEILTTKAFLKSDGWKSVLNDLCCLKVSLAEYVGHISRAEENLKAAHFKADKENRLLKTISANLNRKQMVQVLYHDLEEKLESLPPYVELNVIFFAPTERRAKFNYISGMEFSFPIQMYRSFKPVATFVWKLCKAEYHRKGITQERARV